MPTLAELRQHLLDTGRDDLTWDDINNLRARDANGHVIDTNGATAGGAVFTGEALVLDMNPRFDAVHLHLDDNNAATSFDANSTAKVDAAIAYMNSHMADAGRAGDVLTFAVNPATSQMELALTLGSDLPAGPEMTFPSGTVLHGAYAMAPFVNFGNFSISVTDDGFYNAVSEIMMASISDHYIAGDGRANENFGLTALHHVFHENHNVQLLNLQNSILGDSDVVHRHGFQVDTGHTDSAGNYVLGGANIDGAATVTQIAWDQDKMFEATKLINEMEYQHVAIDQYARLVTPDLPEFVTYDSTINSDISLEYSQAAFRFGHSQLRETIDSIDPSGMITKFALTTAFLNPGQFAATGAADILRGMSQQLTNEVDEFVTPAMQQSLLGQSLDLAAINIARGRDVGLPTLNEARAAMHDALIAERAADPSTPHHTNLIVDNLNPYSSWAEFASQMQHPESLVNFIAAYSFDGDLAKAEALVGLENGTIEEGTTAAMGYSLDQAIDFLNNSLTAEDFPSSGFGSGLTADQKAELADGSDAFDDIDLWIGGLAEIHVFTGQLGTTFNAIFEDQMERLMDGDRFYYLYRLLNALPVDSDLGHSIATEQFKDIIERTTGVLHLNGDVMGYADSTLELARNLGTPQAQRAFRGEMIYTSAGLAGGLVEANQGDLKYDADGALMLQTLKTAHAYGEVLASHAGDTNNNAIGDHRANTGLGIFSGFGNGTAGNGGLITKTNTDLQTKFTYIRDFRPDQGENPDGTPNAGYNSHEVISGTDFNDWIDLGNGDDAGYGDKGDDVLDGKAGADHLYGGDGQDVLYGGDIEDFLDGGRGDDVIYAGTSAGGLDVVIGGDGDDRIYGEAGIDEMYGGAGDDYIDAGGDTDLAFGDAGQDQMYGGDGPDELRGGLGDDILGGGSGADKLLGEGGDDIMLGGIGQAGGTGDSDEDLGGDGFDIASFSDVNTVLDAVADLRNQGLTVANGATPSTPFNQLWTEIEGLIGSRYNDVLIGADDGVGADGQATGNNWLIGGGGNDTIGTATADELGSFGSGGNDVIVGDTIRLDTLIGKYAYLADGLDSLGNAIHGVVGGLTGGLLANAGLGTEMFAKHFTDLLKNEALKDFTLGMDGGAAGTDTAIFSGNFADYVRTKIVYDSGNSDGMVTAWKFQNINGGPDGTDLLIGMDYAKFADRIINLNAVNHDPTGNVGFVGSSGTVSNGNTAVAVLTPTSAIFDVDSISLANPAGSVSIPTSGYNWQRSTDSGATWTSFGSSGSNSTTFGAANTQNNLHVLRAGQTNGTLVRLVATYVDGGGNPESVSHQYNLIVGTNSSATHNGTTSTTLSDAIFGLGGNDTLNGQAGDDYLDGGSGVDRLVGGTGDDTYVIDSNGFGNSVDTIIENLNAGTDTVLSSVSYTLGANLENLTLTGNSGISGTGNSGANVITGNGSNNTIVGGGGEDTMIGGNGSDTYTVDSLGDVVIEVVGGSGRDTIQTTLTSYTLGADIENLSYTGSSPFTGTGNALYNIMSGGSAANTLIGLDGNDTLNGQGGNDSLYGGNGDDHLIGVSGTDILTGGAGSDVFEFRNNNATSNSLATADVITDIEGAGVSGGDRIDLSNFSGTFQFIGTAGFSSNNTNQVRYYIDNLNNRTVVEIDTDGDSNSEGIIILSGLHTMIGSDFML
ncbi:MAG: peroxidase family protein [bacterium]